MPLRASRASALSFSLPVGWLPALIACQPAGARWLNTASLMSERQELPVQRKRTFMRSFSCCRWGTGGRARAPAAAVFAQEAEQGVHGVELRGVDQEAAFLARRDQLRVREFLQVEGQRRGRHAERFRDPAGGQ